MSPEPGRVLALDLGNVRVGVAVSDPLGLTAQPLETFRRGSPDEDLRQVRRLVASRGVDHVVVGNPLLLSGEAGEQSRQAEQFAQRLREGLDGVTVSLWDERLSSVQAEREMTADNVGRRKRRMAVDAIAAALILQSFLDARRSREEGRPV